MICPKYDALTPKEKTDYIGKVVHAIMNDEELFERGLEIIELGNMSGLFDRVVINPTEEGPKDI